MPRPAKGPRLYLRERAGRDPVWVVLDGSKEHGTGCGPDDRRGAAEALQRYLAHKHQPEWRNRDPDQVMIADVLNLYGKERAPNFAHPELVGFHMTPLLSFFEGKTCGFIDDGSCQAYVRARENGLDGRRPVKSTTARRELETLAAALTHALRRKKLAVPVFVALPNKAPARQRWLQPSEAAALLAGALGYEKTEDGWKRTASPQYHVARFILIGLYTGTRHEAILQMRWGVNSEGGWFDLDRGVMYRRGDGAAETTKRRVTAPIPHNLLPHLRRWRRITAIGPVEYESRLILKERRGWDSARDRAGLGDDVTPHVLKHTCITWMLQNRVPIWEVAGFTGTSEKVIRETYGHHSPDHLASAAQAFLGRSLGRTPQKGA
jgi:integrase